VTNWDVYGYGTAAYQNVLKTALQVHQDNNLIMNFCLAPQSGQGVPAQADDEGLEYNMVRLVKFWSSGLELTA
jgi:hypothetical protein